MFALAAATTVLAATSGATVVGAAGGYTAWSELSGGGRYVLVVRAPDGSISRPPVAPRSVPFDLDLGVTGPGPVVASYSRCDKEPTARGGANTIGPQYALGRGCSIHVLNLTSNTELAVPRAAGDASEVLPSAAGNVLAYVVPRGRRALLMVRDVTTGAVRQVDRGPLQAAGSKLFQGPTSVDTDGRRVVASW